jgi:hypothetical protein
MVWGIGLLVGGIGKTIGRNLEIESVSLVNVAAILIGP